MSLYLTCLFLFFSNSPAVDTVRQSLEADSSRWFGWLIRASILVGIGVILEAPEATVALKRWYHRWRGKDVEQENERSLLIPISYLGLLLVVVGVAGEGIFEFRSSHAETALRSHDEQILAETESKFGQIKDSAEVAAKAARQSETSASTAEISAKGASTISEEAVASAARAIALAKDARREADSFEQEIASANKTATEAEKHLAQALRQAAQAEAELNRLKTPRSLTNPSELMDVLKPFKGTEYHFSGVFGDEESLALLEQLDQVLTAAGWKRIKLGDVRDIGIPVVQIGSNDGVYLTTNSGVRIEVQSPESVGTLQALPQDKRPSNVRLAVLLNQQLFAHIAPSETFATDKGVDISPGSSNVINIRIGKKP